MELYSRHLSYRRLHLTLLLKQMTGHREQPRVQQQHTQPQNNHLTLTGKVFFNTLFILITVALNSSGATRDIRPLGNSDSKRLLRPNLGIKRLHTLIIFSSIHELLFL